jgi:heat shock protein HslJ
MMNQYVFKFLWVLFSGLLLCGCGGNKKSTQSMDTADPPDMHTSKNSLDWAGSYLGVIPCADCMGIVQVLELKANDSYQLSSEYLGKAKKRFIEEGEFSWNPEGSKITLDNEQMYWLNENAVVMLDREGQRIEGELRDRYRLSKTEVGPLSETVPADVSSSKWAVYWVDGMDWQEKMKGSAHFSITDKMQLVGAGPCNRFQAEAEIPATQVLNLGKMAATKRACPQLEGEQDYFSALGTVQYYFVFSSQIALLDDTYRPVILGRQKSND